MPRRELGLGGPRRVLLFPADPANPPFLGVSAFGALGPWMLRFTRAPVRRSSDSPHPSSFPKAAPGPTPREPGLLEPERLPAQGETHLSDRKEQTWRSPRASER